ncbi:cupredoxin domain-containing protein [Flavitalea flava]
MEKRNFLPALILVLSVAVFVSYCGKGSSYMTPPANNTNMVNMQNMSFSVTSLQVTAGATVTWTNNDNLTHTVTADDASFNSGDILPGHTFSMAFNTKGTFPYHCKYHAVMKASVTAK